MARQLTMARTSLACLIMVSLLRPVCAARVTTVPDAIEFEGPHGSMRLYLAGEPGRYSGFDLQVDDRPRVQVRFAAANAILCAQPKIAARAGTKVITFDNLAG